MIQNNLIKKDYLYPVDIASAIQIQKQLAEQVKIMDDFGSIKYIAGLDVSHNIRDPNALIYAVCVIINSNDLSIIETSQVQIKQEFPYISGLLGFREAPALIRAIQQCKTKPDLIFVDGHGISHPRRLGIASHIGVLINIPTIGVAKSILVGKPKETVLAIKDNQTDLIYRHEKIATVLYTKNKCKPLYISPGHRISFETAVLQVQNYLKGYRLPEPTRLAHLAANQFRLANK